MASFQMFYKAINTKDNKTELSHREHEDSVDQLFSSPHHFPDLKVKLSLNQTPF